MSDFRWSFSQWESYNTCPAKWKFSKTHPELRKPAGPAAARGTDMHDRVERYIKGEIDITELRFGNTAMRYGQKKPAIISEKFVPMLDTFRNHPNGERHTELKLGFDDDFTLCGGIGGRPWLIMVLDAVKGQDGIIEIGEWKSGSPKPTHADQRKIYALGGLRKFFGCTEVRATTYYLEDTAPPERLVVKPSAEEKLRALWKGRVEEMQNNSVCAPRPGDYCKWMCDWAKSKGGPCVFGA